MTQPQRRVEFVAATSSTIPDCFVSIAGPGYPTLVAIHGISRNAAEIATRFAGHPAFAGVNIVAPLFEPRRFGRYQQLVARKAGQTRADHGLFALLAELAEDRGVAADKVLLFGFSGGAQMAHRLAMLHPGRVSRLCAVSAGWYLLPDAELPYPYGLGAGCPEEAASTNFLDVPTTVIVGNRDTRKDASVRQDPEIVSRQGSNRLRRARIWTRLMQDCARDQGRQPNVSLLTLADAAHDFSRCAAEAALLDHVAEGLLPGKTCNNGQLSTEELQAWA